MLRVLRAARQSRAFLTAWAGAAASRRREMAGYVIPGPGRASCLVGGECSDVLGGPGFTLGRRPLDRKRDGGARFRMVKRQSAGPPLLRCFREPEGSALGTRTGPQGRAPKGPRRSRRSRQGALLQTYRNTSTTRFPESINTIRLNSSATRRETSLHHPNIALINISIPITICLDKSFTIWN